MPRARRLHKRDIQARTEVFRPYSDAAIAAEAAGSGYVLKQANAGSREAVAKIAAVAKKASIPPDAYARFAAKVELAWGRYLLEDLVDRQEHAAQVIATLRPFRREAERLLRRLQSFPPFLRWPLRAHEVEVKELIAAIEAEIARWLAEARAGRLPARATLLLRQGLRATFAEVGRACPAAHDGWRMEMPRGKARCCERCLNRWTDMALDELGVDHSDPKKNPRRFRGG
jgi:hypothetical protein